LQPFSTVRSLFRAQENGGRILENIAYDATGKINLNGIYNRSEPTSYFSALSRLGYRIPQEAKPRFQSLSMLGVHPEKPRQ
jgi:hypothetical protein